LIVGPINAPALIEISRLLEQPGHQLLPDAVWVSGRAHIFKHLRVTQALSVSNLIADSVLCPDCMSEALRPEVTTKGPEYGYRAYCNECGWIEFPKERARVWHANPAKIADWLNVALGLKSRYLVREIVKGILWHLGEKEFKRQRKSVFFGCQLTGGQASARKALEQIAAPGTDVIITTSDLALLRDGTLGSSVFVPLGAIAQFRKGGLIVDNLNPYIDGLAPASISEETSLRLMESKRVALMAGVEKSLSPQVYKFLKVLLKADGDEVHKSHIAKVLGLHENFRYADIKKRHREVFDSFVESDQRGNYWLHPDYIL
jgi:hypothetical protein